MKLGAIVVCRMDSSRVPGKVLRRAGGRPLLWWVLDRVARACAAREAAGAFDTLIVATTSRAVDRAIAATLADYRAWRERSLAAANERAREGSPAPVLFEYGGRVEDVSGRLLAAADAHALDGFARINADSPFVEPALLSRACSVMRDRRVELDFVTNLAPRTYPYGVAVEVVRTGAYRGLLAACGPQEHPMQPVYAGLDRLAWTNLRRTGSPQSGVRMTIDTEDDWRQFEAVIAASGADWIDRPYQTFVADFAGTACPAAPEAACDCGSAAGQPSKRTGNTT